MSLLSRGECEGPRFLMKWHTTLWIYTQAQASNVPTLHFQNIVCQFWAEERSVHRRSPWSDIQCLEIEFQLRLGKRAETRHASPGDQLQNIVCHFLDEERAWGTPVPHEVTSYLLKLDASWWRNRSLRVHFQNIVCHIWAEERGIHCQYALSNVLCLENVHQISYEGESNGAISKHCMSLLLWGESDPLPFP